MHGHAVLYTKGATSLHDAKTPSSFWSLHSKIKEAALFGCAMLQNISGSTFIVVSDQIKSVSWCFVDGSQKLTGKVGATLDNMLQQSLYIAAMKNQRLCSFGRRQ